MTVPIAPDGRGLREQREWKAVSRFANRNSNYQTGHTIVFLRPVFTVVAMNFHVAFE